MKWCIDKKRISVTMLTWTAQAPPLPTPPPAPAATAETYPNRQWNHHQTIEESETERKAKETRKWAQHTTRNPMPNCAKEMNWMTPNRTEKTATTLKKWRYYIWQFRIILLCECVRVCVLAHMTIKQSNLFVGSFICDTSLFCHTWRV